MDDSGRIEELTRELDALRAMKNSYGYQLLIERVRHGAYKSIDAFLEIDPQEVGKVGIYQGDILAARRLTGYVDRESLLELMIDEAQEELDKLTREDTPRTGRPDSMRMSSLRR